ncbi:maleylpyruvate isomerase family mycothiol-dependent enzyme [Streptomyces sp. SID14478]|uniref:maleylpyruvate isomerase family mycothiol-dependent enzyme n=1 Tax=Streptomyces sp. SID14478 TaxID=2706073 RepID=UPI0013E05622|nr:maleylpyruvate isomerase family mycothiol-dependent enzyme [Streptomyces sp. SID14478]NEB81047.1 maleylpyruvate isomerase family mycothiol-dependent enzyme [Streptomyces sp. SID14478]
MTSPKTPKKRVRSYDPAKIRAAVLAQFGNVRKAVDSLTPEQLASPTRLGDWTVRDLVAHLSMALGTVDLFLSHPVPPKAEDTALDWPFATAASAAGIADRSRDLARQHPDLAALLARTEERFREHLDTTDDARVLPARSLAIPFGDYLVTRTVELVVHTDDMNDALPGLDIPYDRQALAAATRLLADALAVKAPGASTEVRIPPFAVVQCVEGPRHTRGTPPNVVETDPLTWIRLATGRTHWAAALDGAHVSASGERADLSGLLPIMA